MPRADAASLNHGPHAIFMISARRRGGAGSSPLDGAMTTSHTGGVLRARTEKPQARDVEREAAAPGAVRRPIPFPLTFV